MPHPMVSACLTPPSRSRRFIDAVVGPEPITFVVHDWGSALGFEWAMRHQDRVAGIAYMEALVRPFSELEEFPQSAAEMFQQLRTAAGEEMKSKPLCRTTSAGLDNSPAIRRGNE